jgi:hypothetical protein
VARVANPAHNIAVNTRTLKPAQRWKSRMQTLSIVDRN